MKENALNTSGPAPAPAPKHDMPQSRPASENAPTGIPTVGPGVKTIAGRTTAQMSPPVKKPVFAQRPINPHTGEDSGLQMSMDALADKLHPPKRRV